MKRLDSILFSIPSVQPLIFHDIYYHRERSRTIYRIVERIVCYRTIHIYWAIWIEILLAISRVGIRRIEMQSVEMLCRKPELSLQSINVDNLVYLSWKLQH